LFNLREALRTEPSVELVVLFGSRARGDHHEHSDVDLLVSTRGKQAVRKFAARLSRRLELPVQVVTLDDAKANARLFAEVLREGRVLIDRSGTWPGLKRRYGSVARAAGLERDNIRNRFDAAFAVRP
jgi:predicted nucleotidyltransferase